MQPCAQGGVERCGVFAVVAIQRGTQGGEGQAGLHPQQKQAVLLTEIQDAIHAVEIEDAAAARYGSARDAGTRALYGDDAAVAGGFTQMAAQIVLVGRVENGFGPAGQTRLVAQAVGGRFAIVVGRRDERGGGRAGLGGAAHGQSSWRASSRR